MKTIKMRPHKKFGDCSTVPFPMNQQFKYVEDVERNLSVTTRSLEERGAASGDDETASAFQSLVDAHQQVNHETMLGAQQPLNNAPLSATPGGKVQANAPNGGVDVTAGGLDPVLDKDLQVLLSNGRKALLGCLMDVFITNLCATIPPSKFK